MVGSQARLGPDVLPAFSRYDLLGNLRELENVMVSLAVIAPHRGAAYGRAVRRYRPRDRYQLTRSCEAHKASGLDATDLVRRPIINCN